MTTHPIHRLRRGAGVGAGSLVAVGLVLVFAGGARAAAPVLVSVGSQSRHPTATWTLPPGVQAKSIEVATSPEVA